MAELIFYNMYLVKGVWEGQQQRCAGAGRKKRMEKVWHIQRKTISNHTMWAALLIPEVQLHNNPPE